MNLKELVMALNEAVGEDLPELDKTVWATQKEIEDFKNKANELLKDTVFQYSTDVWLARQLVKEGDGDYYAELVVPSVKDRWGGIMSATSFIRGFGPTKLKSILPTSVRGCYNTSTDLNKYLSNLSNPKNIKFLQNLGDTAMLRRREEEKAATDREGGLDNPPKARMKRKFWKNDGISIYVDTYDDKLRFNNYGEMIRVELVMADEWETKEITDFENAYWFPMVEPDVNDLGEGKEIDITPNNTGSCSLEDALKAIGDLQLVTPPKYSLLVEFLKDIESWTKTGTLDVYLEKHEETLKALCA